MTEVKIVTSANCNFCHTAKHLLDQRNIDYQEIDLFKQNEQAQQLIQQSGQRTVPQIFINDKPIGGFNELSQLIANNELNLTELTAN